MWAPARSMCRKDESSPVSLSALTRAIFAHAPSAFAKRRRALQAVRPSCSWSRSSAGSADSYKPRVLSASGRRVFFDSRDALVLSDTNKDDDAYEWEAQGEGGCARAQGCVSLISSGRASEGASFVDASADGSDAFFLTDGSLVPADPGAVDLYDARAGGGFPEPAQPIICEGDNCQSLPPAPVDPTLTTLQPGPGNPPVRYQHRHKRHHKHRHRGKHRHGKRHGSPR